MLRIDVWYMPACVVYWCMWCICVFRMLVYVVYCVWYTDVCGMLVYAGILMFVPYLCIWYIAVCGILVFCIICISNPLKANFGTNS